MICLYQLFIQANLRACNEEMRSHVNDLRLELDTHRSLLLKTQRDKVIVAHPAEHQCMCTLVVLDISGVQHQLMRNQTNVFTRGTNLL